MKSLMFVLFVLLFSGCATWKGVKKDVSSMWEVTSNKSAETWEKTKEKSSDTYDDTKEKIDAMEE